MNKSIHFIFSFFVYFLPVLLVLTPIKPSFANDDIHFHHINSDWSNCGHPSDVGHLNYLDVTPDPLIKGKQAKIKFDFTTLETITSGLVKYSVKYKGIPIHSGASNICSSQIKCPIKQGTYNGSHTVTIPTQAPSGDYYTQINAYDQKHREIFCVNYKLTVKDDNIRRNIKLYKEVESINPQVLWQIGKAVWKFISENKPSINITDNWGGAVPKDISDWRLLQQWREDVWSNHSKPFYFEFKSGFFGETVRLEWVWSYKYNGNYNGVGKYITQAMPVITNAHDIAFEKLQCTTRVWNPVNYGTTDNPVAGIDMDLACFTLNKFDKNILNCHVILRGDNKHQVVTCNTGILHL